MSIIYVLPYLELREALALGDGYEVAPESEIAADDPLADDARAVLAMYTRPSTRHDEPAGAVVLSEETTGKAVTERKGCGRLGSEFSEAGLRRVHRTVGLALLEANPRADVSGYSSNAGQQAWTSENALIRGHRVAGDGIFVWAHNGIRSSRSIDSRLGKVTDVVPLPVGVEIPITAAWPDAYVTALTWRALGSGTQRSRRIGQAIDWLMAAWQNAELSADNRISSLHSGFDALLGDDDDDRSGAHALRQALCGLLDDPNAPTTHCRLAPRRGAIWEGRVSERGIWAFEFIQLRNGVAHGYDIQPDEYLYKRGHHVNRAETELRLAILASIADELDCPALRISDRFSRLLEFITADAMTALSGSEPD